MADYNIVNTWDRLDSAGKAYTVNSASDEQLEMWASDTSRTQSARMGQITSNGTYLATQRCNAAHN